MPLTPGSTAALWVHGAEVSLAALPVWRTRTLGFEGFCGRNGFTPTSVPATPGAVPSAAEFRRAVMETARFPAGRDRMELSFGKGALLLLLVAAVVAMLTRRLRLPYSAGLVLAGMGLAFLPLAPKVAFTPEILFDALLPPLLFEAALSLRWDELRRQLPVVLLLASAGVVLSGAVTAAGMHYLAGWPWQGALVFGALIAATDPVSVIATFREAGARGRLRLLIESESLFNDGTAAVAFGVAVTLAAERSLSGWDVAATLVATIGGGLVCGAATGILALLLAGRTEDHLVELTVTTVAAYGSFLLAEHLHFSGVVDNIPTPRDC